MKNSSSCETAEPMDTDYIELSLEGLEETKVAINGIGSLISSSCIPSLCSAGLLEFA